LPVIKENPVDPNAKVTLRGLLFVPEESPYRPEKSPYISPIHFPRWAGPLYFRRAKLEETEHLKALYESSWNNEDTKRKPITISTDQISSCIKNFPDGQIVGCEKQPKGGKANDLPVSMINIMLASFDPKKGFKDFDGGYEKITGERTFSTTMQPEPLLELAVKSKGSILPIAFCVSIAVPPQYRKEGYAFQTLKYAVIFSEFNSLVPCPYSAPRELAKARRQNPDLDIQDYLMMTLQTPNKKNIDPVILHAKYLGHILAISDRLSKAFSGGSISPKEIFNKYHSMPSDTPCTPIGKRAFDAFLSSESQALEEQYGRKITIEDFCLMTGRPLLDPIIGMHVANGARFIRDEKGGIIAVFKDSRPEDLAADGYNIVLSYSYRPHLGHKF